ncbi:hypothetical protein N7495_007424 [Penicillium taxi]|uniref:uncharacterized protein n=1 Tax=Penicillium taxi TaxID=168475 RepID=UPI0025456873|nr:uncharacterized protein N7495_007424 [Penicillium taxi]KAJ5887383.1 hypothetical protein N7495_007424 [Penicillium taxi]
MTLDIAHKDELYLDVAAPLGWHYSPGDIIIGDIVRKSPLVSLEARINEWLTGVMRVSILRLRVETKDLWSDHEAYDNK